MKTYIITIFTICVTVGIGHAQNVNDIIMNLEKNRVYSGLYAEGSIIIKDKYGTRETDFISYSKGGDYSLIEYTSAAERGQKNLRVKDNIYLYYPDAEQVITLNKSMFQQSMLDSDISYEDMSGDKSILDSFTAELLGEEVKNGKDCYVIYLSAINDRKETYPYQKLWVSKDTYIAQYTETYTRKKKLRKQITMHNVERLSNGSYVVTDILIKDVLKDGEGTRVKLDVVELEELDDDVFSVENLKF